MDEVSEDALAEEYVRTAKQALTISEDCVSAWLEMVIHEEDDAKAMELIEKGIERGRVRFEEQIRSVDEERGLWSWIEARDFMRLLHEKAKLHEAGKEPETAMETYREMLALDPKDNQGVRGGLLFVLLVFRRLDEARALLDAFPSGGLIDMVYGRAFLSLVEGMERAGIDVSDFDAPGLPKTPAGWFKHLGPEFASAEKELKRAVNGNPFVALFISRPGLLKVEPDEMRVFGGPYEGITYLQKWCALWYFSGLPFILLSLLAPGNPKKLIKSKYISEELVK